MSIYAVSGSRESTRIGSLHVLPGVVSLRLWMVSEDGDSSLADIRVTRHDAQTLLRELQAALQEESS